jgi:nucleoside-diphosphate-sugar epimerase
VRIAVTGATGNVGTSVLAALAQDSAVTSIVGIARRKPTVALAKVEWRSADVVCDDLVPLFRGADAVVHLTWVVQPNHREAEMRAVNVDGTRRVHQAVAAAGVPVLIQESAFGAYSGGAGDRPVDESWPTDGIPSSWYSRQKAEVERALDVFADEHPYIRLVRFRSALTLKREAGAQAHRLYGGPLLLRALVRPGRVPFVPDVPGVRIQAVHSADVGDAYRRAVVGDVRGPFNLAAEPVLTPVSVAAAIGSRRMTVPAQVMRAAVHASWVLRLQPTSPDWLDLMIQPPLLDTTRARVELGWTPAHSATDALCEFLEGIADGAGAPTPPLAPLAVVRPSFRP